MLHNVQSTSSSILDTQDNNLLSASPTSKTGKSRNIDYNLNLSILQNCSRNEDIMRTNDTLALHDLSTEISGYAKVMYNFY